MQEKVTLKYDLDKSSIFFIFQRQYNLFAPIHVLLLTIMQLFTVFFFNKKINQQGKRKTNIKNVYFTSRRLARLCVLMRYPRVNVCERVSKCAHEWKYISVFVFKYYEIMEVIPTTKKKTCFVYQSVYSLYVLLQMYTYCLLQTDAKQEKVRWTYLHFVLKYILRISKGPHI